MSIEPPVLGTIFLLLVGNGAPILARIALHGRCATPLDFGRRFLDERPWFGPSKTYRGLIAAVTACAVAAPLVNLSLAMGAAIGLFTMLGDVLCSFCKRRMGSKAASVCQVWIKVWRLWFRRGCCGIPCS